MKIYTTFLTALVVLVMVLAISTEEVEAKRRSGSSTNDERAESSGGRVRFGTGLSRNVKYNGPTLSRSQLATCIRMQIVINHAFDKLERDEAYISSEQKKVDSYSQSSVDNFNRLISQFNADGQKANVEVNRFNSQCANRAYYESDMLAVRREIVGS